MKLSTKSRYGLRILLQIAMDSVKNSPVKGSVIAKKQEISEPYLEQIMIPLKNSGLVRTMRGCNGGYVLNRKIGQITILDIVELFEGKVQLVNCDDCKRQCAVEKSCPTSLVWERISQAIRAEAQKITLADVVEMGRKDEPEYMI